MKFEVLTAMLLKIQVFLDVKLWQWASSSQHSETTVPSSLKLSSARLPSFELLETVHQMTKHHIPQHLNLQQHHFEKLKSCNTNSFLETKNSVLSKYTQFRTRHTKA